MADLLRIDGYFALVNETDWEELNHAFTKWSTRKGYRFHGIIWPTTEERMQSANDGPSIPSDGATTDEDYIHAPYTIFVKAVENVILNIKECSFQTGGMRDVTELDGEFLAERIDKEVKRLGGGGASDA